MRSLAEFTPAAAASSSLDTVGMSCSANAYRTRRYTGRRAIVASGMPWLPVAALPAAALPVAALPVAALSFAALPIAALPFADTARRDMRRRS